jgi:hypothetical protein
MNVRFAPKADARVPLMPNLAPQWRERMSAWLGSATTQMGFSMGLDLRN